MGLYGVRRRSWPGTIIALTGLAIANVAMIIGNEYVGRSGH
jgi:hypothetical protein